MFFGGPPNVSPYLPHIPGVNPNVVATSPLMHNWDVRLNNFSYHDRQEMLITDDRPRVQKSRFASQDMGSSSPSQQLALRASKQVSFMPADLSKIQGQQMIED